MIRANRERFIARNSSVNPNVLTTDAMFNLTYTIDYEKDVEEAATTSSVLSNSRDFYIRGSLKDLNMALGRLFYLPDANYNGMDDLVFNLCDSGQVIILSDRINTQNQPLCMNRTLPISIKPINDPPGWRHPKVPVFVSEDSSYLFSGRSIELFDVDSGDHEVYVSIASDYGTLSIDDLPLRLTLLDGTTGDHDSTL